MLACNLEQFKSRMRGCSTEENGGSGVTGRDHHIVIMFAAAALPDAEKLIKLPTAAKPAPTASATVAPL